MPPKDRYHARIIKLISQPAYQIRYSKEHRELILPILKLPVLIKQYSPHQP